MKNFLITLALVGCAGAQPDSPPIVLSNKASCELKTTAALEAAHQAGLSCEQAKPALDLLLKNDPDCKSYFGDAGVEIDCVD